MTVETENAVYPTLTIEATYSAEDNKLRLYASERLDPELYAVVKEAGFKWAPRQELFVAPKWTPGREDLCIELAGEITAEQTTIVERAEAKADRLDTLAVKRAQDSNSFFNAASAIAERFAGGQPILVGHHSERKARRDQEKMNAAMAKAVKAQDAVSYWHYKAEGVERHANMKGNAQVRARRIKKLLAELRDRQRAINHAQICLKLWHKIDAMEDAEEKANATLHYVGGSISTGSCAPYMRGESLWSQLEKGAITGDEVIQRCVDFHDYQASNPYTLRWINHILNRLAFERCELGDVARYTGALTAVILQAFAREHGAHKPKATQDGEKWTIQSTVDLPAHIANGKTSTLYPEAWAELMHASGYEVPTPKPRRRSTKTQVPLINPSKEEAEKLQAIWNAKALEKHNGVTLGGVTPSDIRAMSQAKFSANSKGSYSAFSTIELDLNGNKVWSSYKGKTAEPVCRIRTGSGGGSIYSPASIIVIEDKPSRPLPINWGQA